MEVIPPVFSSFIKEGYVVLLVCPVGTDPAWLEAIADHPQVFHLLPENGNHSKKQLLDFHQRVISRAKIDGSVVIANDELIGIPEFFRSLSGLSFSKVAAIWMIPDYQQFRAAIELEARKLEDNPLEAKQMRAMGQVSARALFSQSCSSARSYQLSCPRWVKWFIAAPSWDDSISFSGRRGGSSDFTMAPELK